MLQKGCRVRDVSLGRGADIAALQWRKLVKKGYCIGTVVFHCVCCALTRTHIFFWIYSSVLGLLGCFHSSTIVNGLVMNIGMHVLVFFPFFGYIPRNGNAGSNGRCDILIFDTFDILRNPHVFQELDQSSFQRVQKGSLFSISSILAVTGLFDMSHSHRLRLYLL